MPTKLPIRRFSQLSALADDGQFPVDLNGKNVLHHLCDEEDPDVGRIQQYVKAGCNFVEPNMKDHGFTPFAYAVALQHRKVIQVFLSALIGKRNVPGLAYAFELLYRDIELPLVPKIASFERLYSSQAVVDALMYVAEGVDGQKKALPE